MKNNKKASFNLLIEFAMVLAVITIVSIMIFNVNEDARDDLVAGQSTTATCNTTSGIYTGCGYGYNATQKSDEALYKIPSQLKLLATAVVFGVVLYVIFRVVPINSLGGSSF